MASSFWLTVPYTVIVICVTKVGTQVIIQVGPIAGREKGKLKWIPIPIKSKLSEDSNAC